MTSIASRRRHAITRAAFNLCKCRSATPCPLREPRARHDGSGRDDRYWHDHLGQPDLQALGDLSVGRLHRGWSDHVADAGGEGVVISRS